MVQLPTEIHPLKSSPPGFLKLPLDITTHLFLSRMDPCILLVRMNTDNWGWYKYQQKYTHSNPRLGGFANCRWISPLTYSQIRWVPPYFWLESHGQLGWYIYQQKYTHTNSCLRGFANCRRRNPLTYS